MAQPPLLRRTASRMLLVTFGVAYSGWRMAMAWVHIDATTDAEADIRDLDVGDLDDMESDVTKEFLDMMAAQKAKAPKLGEFGSKPQDWAAGMATGTQMTFAYLTQQKAESLGKVGTEKLAGSWVGMLQTGGVGAQAYAIDPGKILFVTSGPGLIQKLKEFVLVQDEVDWFEHQQSMHFPEGRTAPLMAPEERKWREIELGWREPAKATAKAEAKKKSPKKKQQQKEL
eukprot:NODE_14171_length_1124_cov_6.848546.p1 GENE.NODE_14171_length_1124_cov_6.848546~~NODE_14171_length_1124_cov_6.848546.p1  ORF type:complete len:228 (+),score=78.89 NODE_14171_length_1124_cov_6.848546:126-809(+)